MRERSPNNQASRRSALLELWETWSPRKVFQGAVGKPESAEGFPRRLWVRLWETRGLLRVFHRRSISCRQDRQIPQGSGPDAAQCAGGVTMSINVPLGASGLGLGQLVDLEALFSRFR